MPHASFDELLAVIDNTTAAIQGQSCTCAEADPDSGTARRLEQLKEELRGTLPRWLKMG